MGDSSRHGPFLITTGHLLEEVTRLVHNDSFGLRKVESCNVCPVYTDGGVTMASVLMGAQSSGSNLGREGSTSSLSPVSVIREWTLLIGICLSDPDDSS